MHTTSSHYASTTTSLGHVSGNNTKVSRLLCSTIPRVNYFPNYFITTIENASISKLILIFLPMRKITEGLIKEEKLLGVWQCIS